jgi:hypothetical protein
MLSGNSQTLTLKAPQPCCQEIIAPWRRHGGYGGHAGYTLFLTRYSSARAAGIQGSTGFLPAVWFVIEDICLRAIHLWDGISRAPSLGRQILSRNDSIELFGADSLK